MFDTPDSCRPEHHSSVIANELIIGNASLSDVHLPEKGSRQEHTAEYVLN